MNPPDSGQQIRRRTIVHGVAWTIPAIAAAVAVPSASASTCTPKRVQIDWSAFTRTDVNSGTGIGADEEGTPYPFQVSVRHGRAVQAASSNLNVWGKNTSNAMVNLTSLLSDPSYATTGDGLLSDYYSILTVNFLRPVTAVSFTVWDVDSSSSKTDRYTEHVSTSPKATRETAGSGLRRTGPTNLWWSPSDDTRGDVDTLDKKHSVAYQMDTQVSSVEIWMCRKMQSMGGGGVGISNMTFTTVCSD